MITLTPFQPQDQAEARSLILSGLVEHWGWLDVTKNPDLDDIAASFAGGYFLVARQDGRLVATGGLLPTPDPKTWQIVRMSVAADMRRAGLGRQILDALEHEARQRRARRLILETTATWQDVIGFYLRCGFRIILNAEAQGGVAAPLFPAVNGNSGELRAAYPHTIPPNTEDVYFEKWL